MAARGTTRDGDSRAVGNASISSAHEPRAAGVAEDGEESYTVALTIIAQEFIQRHFLAFFRRCNSVNRRGEEELTGSIPMTAEVVVVVNQACVRQPQKLVGVLN